MKEISLQFIPTKVCLILLKSMELLGFLLFMGMPCKFFARLAYVTDNNEDQEEKYFFHPWFHLGKGVYLRSLSNMRKVDL